MHLTIPSVSAQGSAVEDPPAIQEEEAEEKAEREEEKSEKPSKQEGEKSPGADEQDKSDPDQAKPEQENAQPENKDDETEKSEDDDQKTEDESAGNQKDEGAEPRRTRSGSTIRSVTARRRNSKTSPEFAELFQPVVASASASTAIVYAGRRQIAMGTVVDSDGFILTKASEMRDDLKCKLADGNSYSASVYGVDPVTDLALLKIDANNLPSVEWSNNPTPAPGRWVATPNHENEAIAIGVISVNEREILPSRPFIGIQMRPTENNAGVRINQVIPDTPADRSGILINDIVVKLDDIDIPDRETLVDSLGQYTIGDVATLTVKRGDKKVKIRLVLADEENKNPQFDRTRQQNSMGSTLSKRRKNFPLAFQHDSMLDAKNCGGPLVDLDGRVVGINIARDGRVSSLALPRSIVDPVIARLKTGEFSPAVVNAEKLKKVDAQLKEVYAKLEELPGKRTELERKVGIADAKKEELEKMLKDIETRLKMIEEKSSGDRTELKSVDKELKIINSAKRRLESKRKDLQAGSQ